MTSSLSPSLQVDVTKKDAQIKALSQQKQELEHKFGVPMSERQTDFIPRSDFEEQGLEVQGLKDQLVGVLEELSARERELQELQDVHHRYQNKMQTYSDQVKRERERLLSCHVLPVLSCHVTLV